MSLDPGCALFAKPGWPCCDKRSTLRGSTRAHRRKKLIRRSHAHHAGHPPVVVPAEQHRLIRPPTTSTRPGSPSGRCLPRRNDIRFATCTTSSVFTASRHNPHQGHHPAPCSTFITIVRLNSAPRGTGSAWTATTTRHPPRGSLPRRPTGSHHAHHPPHRTA
jgi:hypothetical protein